MFAIPKSHPKLRLKRQARNKKVALRRGVECVEVAVTLPLLMIVMFSTIQLCNIIHTEKLLRVACYEAMKAGASKEGGSQRALAVFQDHATALGIKDAKLKIDAKDFDKAKVGQALKLEAVASVKSNLMPAPFNLSSQSILVRRSYRIPKRGTLIMTICPKTNNRCGTKRSGVSVVIVIQLFVVMLIFAFMAINISWVQKNYVAGQIASDLGSRWGVDLTSRTSDHSKIKSEVGELVKQNWNLALPNKHSTIEVEVGSAKPSANGMVFSENSFPVNAVRVKTNAQIAMAGFMGSKTGGMDVARRSTSVAVERDICVVIDRSGSMNFDLNTGSWSEDASRRSDNPLSTSRYSNLRRYAHQFWWYWPHPTRSRWSTMLPALYGLADELDRTAQNEKFSIVSYSTDFNIRFYNRKGQVQNFRGARSGIESKPSFNYESAVRSLENKYESSQLVAGGTNISAGIELATEVLTGDSARPNAFKTMIVMTDGQYNQGGHPKLAASKAADQGIEVFTVTFSHQADQSVMIDTAELGNGKHFHAPGGNALEEIFRQIANIPPAAFID